MEVFAEPHGGRLRWRAADLAGAVAKLAPTGDSRRREPFLARGGGWKQCWWLDRKGSDAAAIFVAVAGLVRRWQPAGSVAAISVRVASWLAGGGGGRSGGSGSGCAEVTPLHRSSRLGEESLSLVFSRGRMKV
ncbi:hypothetical protein VIGAN_09005300 [Vigna angularis var. angularis]|uniref:Uncharacterized protein n=1 Tax=Vigna angularis var. angularis TaxID=157739 RepID=A0A0S3SV87_PHAAN|nr:hypothetical protein VIGAN_09005300 [Vigna angularis var. angularis]